MKVNSNIEYLLIKNNNNQKNNEFKTISDI